MTEQFANDYATTLSGAITDSATSLVVASATGAPTVNFRIRVENELMLVTAVAGATFTVTRGIEGTATVAHADAVAVTHVLTAGGLGQALTEHGGPVIVRGRVNANGTIARGSGFTVNKFATGRYTITFTTAFAAVPVVVATVESTGGATGATILHDAATPTTTTTATVSTLISSGGTFSDKAFDFIAMAVA